MFLINNEARLFRRLQCRKDEGSIFCAKNEKNAKKITKKEPPVADHGCFGVTTSLIINYMQPTVYQTKADDLPQRMMWVELYLMGDNTVGSPLQCRRYFRPSSHHRAYS